MCNVLEGMACLMVAMPHRKAARNRMIRWLVRRGADLNHRDKGAVIFSVLHNIPPCMHM